MKNKYTTLRTVPKSNRKIVENKAKLLPLNIIDRSLSLHGTGSSIKSGRVKLVLWGQSTPLSEMTLPCKCFPNVSKRLILTGFFLNEPLPDQGELRHFIENLIHSF